MKLYLGTHQPHWLWRTDVPLFISRRALQRRTVRSLQPAWGRWALDSGGFTELSMNGRWLLSAEEYVDLVGTYRDKIDGLDFAAPQDWMCEPFMVERTGLSVAEHQERTVANFLRLRELAPRLPFIPVLQGYTVAEYRDCLGLYEQAGVVLAAEPLVGLGSVCRRQATGEIARLVSELACSGLRLHGFGVKTGALAYGYLLASADSMAWSYRARRSEPLPGCVGHRNCANCLTYALGWYRGLVDQVACRPVQMTLAESAADLMGVAS